MRKVRVAEHISLDGIVQPGRPNQNSDYANGGRTAPYPLLLARGKRYFPESVAPRELALISSTATPSGVLVTYRNVGPVRSESFANVSG